MKNIKMVAFIILVSVIMIPFSVSAEDLDLSRYASESLEDAFQAEGITNYDLTNYQETDDRATIYLFRLDGCGNCRNFLNYVASSLLTNYGDKFKVVSYEMRNNPLNLSLRDKIQAYLGESVAVTPYIIIGDKTFNGFIDSTKQKQIEEAIMALYNSNDKYDVLDEMQDKLKNFEDGGITFTSAKGLDKNYVLKVSSVNYSDLKLNDQYSYVAGYDITMYNGSVVVPLSNGSFKIRIPVSIKYDTYKVAYVNGGQINEVFDATYDNGYVQFTTTHLSEYVVYGSNNINNSAVTNVNSSNVSNEKNPQTIDMIQFYVVLFAIGCVGIFGSLKALKKRKSN